MAEAPFPGGGRIIAIDSLTTALAALDEIVEQGEGADPLQVWDGDHDPSHPEREQVSHYCRFLELKLGRCFRTGDPISIDWNGVRPMRSNPRTSDHAPGGPIRTAQEEFNHTYCTLLRQLEQAFNGNPQMLAAAIGSMYGLKAKAQALMLMLMPTEDGLETTGPTFEYVAPR